MGRPHAICVLAVAMVASAACGDDARPSAPPTPPSTTGTQSSDSDGPSSTPVTAQRDELVTAVDAYVRARNGTDREAYRESMCASVRDSAATRRPTTEVTVDRIENVRVDGLTATVTVDLSYPISQDETVGPVRGVQWIFLREGGDWKQCSPPAFGRPNG
ncbi:hypothetical protein [Williamsia sp.]|uniref:Rv0361 family membrane protein n=1 Tax=Williamsia sp. TaxID=1872085 RepID=UPI001A29D51D|nr:hypothetical protein [Williamsia sp.]MBJ7291559.1 hypothetical protein [Williamsia sp.]